MRIPWSFVRWKFEDHFSPAAYVARWTALVAPGAIAIGSAVALFLWALEGATAFRFAQPWLLWLLPVAGLFVGVMYHWLGRSAEGGNNLIMDEIHEPGGGVPARMAPLVLIGTVVTHLFGGSAGREGTAVQMGGAIASTLTRWFKLDPEDTSILLTTGIAAGFGAVFGTPLTGAIFALEVLSIGRMSYRALLPCLIASVIGDLTVSAWGIHHTAYHIAPLAASGFAHLNAMLLAKVVVGAAAFGFASVLFAETTHSISRVFKRAVRVPYLRPVIGAGVLIALTLLVGSRDYLGLSVTSPDSHAVTLVSSFVAGGAHPTSWMWKLLFTAITLGSGFKGGEVTPLFFIGATLGNTLAVLMHAPVDLFAALGFVAVFAGATNTPLACTLMGIELFGADAAIYIATASFVAYLFSGHSGIYVAQRIGTPKGDAAVPPEPTLSLATLHERHRRRPNRAGLPLSPLPLSTTPDADIADVVALNSIGEFHVSNRMHPTWSTHKSSDSHESHVHQMHMSHTAPVGAHAHGSHSDHGLHSHNVPHRGHPIQAHALGQVRVYLKPSDRRRNDGWLKRLLGRRLAEDIVVNAKSFGLPHALVLHTRFGYTGGGPIATDHPEYGIHELPLCVELMGEPHRVEQFCREHTELLVGRMVVFRHAEAWEMVVAPAHEDGQSDIAIA